MNKERKIYMNIKLQKVISLFNERKNFFNNHPDAYRFMLDNFGQDIPVGTEIEISINKNSAQSEKTKIKIEQADKRFIDSLTDILKK